MRVRERGRSLGSGTPVGLNVRHRERSGVQRVPGRAGLFTPIATGGCPGREARSIPRGGAVRGAPPFPGEKVRQGQHRGQDGGEGAEDPGPSGGRGRRKGPVTWRRFRYRRSQRPAGADRHRPPMMYFFFSPLFFLANKNSFAFTFQGLGRWPGRFRRAMISLSFALRCPAGAAAPGRCHRPGEAGRAPAPSRPLHSHFPRLIRWRVDRRENGGLNALSVPEGYTHRGQRGPGRRDAHRPRGLAEARAGARSIPRLCFPVPGGNKQTNKQLRAGENGK